ncbi:MAG: transcriptional repressor [Planctomycetaceae bacterium]
MVNRQHINEVADIRTMVRSAGLRCTSARLAVLQYLRGASSPMTHAEISKALVPLGFDKATLFRNLVDLTDSDLLVRAELGDHVWRFEIRDPDDPDKGIHPHFVCVDCGNVTCLTGIDFNTASKRRAKNIGQVTEILLKGHCMGCESS